MSKCRFHSISFPSEWGLALAAGKPLLQPIVSIQLVSPASGDSIDFAILGVFSPVSIQLVSPASGDALRQALLERFHQIDEFPFN